MSAPPIPLLAISPHLDDAVFACGEALLRHPGAVVASVFAARTTTTGTPTPWDRDAGFAPDEDVVQHRRAEDRAALAVLDAQPYWLEFLDRQYVCCGEDKDRSAIERAIEEALHWLKPSHVLVPLGLYHSDHILASDAALAVALDFPGVRWTAYEDALYRRLAGLVQRRLYELERIGWCATPVDMPAGGIERKRIAVACYASQLRALGTIQRLGHADAFARERYWDLTRA
jgi:LmbE family N-acetylglucosaminyl deacetylase